MPVHAVLTVEEWNRIVADRSSAKQIQAGDEQDRYNKLHDCECGGCCPPDCPDLDDDA
jgi:hypothetical protein